MFGMTKSENIFEEKFYKDSVMSEFSTSVIPESNFDITDKAELKDLSIKIRDYINQYKFNNKQGTLNLKINVIILKEKNQTI
jgi:hypothetical protein